MPSPKPIHDGPPAPVIIEPDAHGQAALMLTESLLHTLIDRGTLTVMDAIEVVQSAAEVKVEVAAAAGESKARTQDSLALLSKIASSLGTDVVAGARLAENVIVAGR